MSERVVHKRECLRHIGADGSGEYQLVISADPGFKHQFEQIVASALKRLASYESYKTQVEQGDRPPCKACGEK